MSEMPTSRTQHLGAAGIMVTIGLLLVLAVQVPVRRLHRPARRARAERGFARRGDHPPPGAGARAQQSEGRGHFTIFGVISDDGTFVDDLSGEPGRGVRVFRGAKGTFRVSIGHFGSRKIARGRKRTQDSMGVEQAELSHGNQGPVGIWMEGIVSQ